MLSMKQPQQYTNHRRFDPGQLFFFMPLGLVTIGCAGAAVGTWVRGGQAAWSFIALVLLAVLVMALAPYARTKALVAQDRAIRAEEQLRHFILTGKRLDERLTNAQIVALRFASDAEFVSLAQQAAEAGWKPGEIKRSIQHWRADVHRV